MHVNLILNNKCFVHIILVENVKSIKLFGGGLRWKEFIVSNISADLQQFESVGMLFLTKENWKRENSIKTYPPRETVT